MTSKLTALLLIAASTVLSPQLALAEPKPSHPSEIVRKLSGYILPRLDMKDVTRGEVLEFMRSRFKSIRHLDEPDSDFEIEFRFSPETMAQKVDVVGENISIAKAIELATQGLQISITLEFGKCIVASKE